MVVVVILIIMGWKEKGMEDDTWMQMNSIALKLSLTRWHDNEPTYHVGFSPSSSFFLSFSPFTLHLSLSLSLPLTKNRKNKKPRLEWTLPCIRLPVAIQNTFVQWQRLVEWVQRKGVKQNCERTSVSFHSVLLY